MKSITIHNIDETLDEMIREKAKKKGASLNKTIQLLLKQALGLNSELQNSNKQDFIELFGVWSELDEKEFMENTAEFNEIDKRDW